MKAPKWKFEQKIVYQVLLSNIYYENKVSQELICLCLKTQLKPIKVFYRWRNHLRFTKNSVKNIKLSGSFFWRIKNGYCKPNYKYNRQFIRQHFQDFIEYMCQKGFCEVDYHILNDEHIRIRLQIIKNCSQFMVIVLKDVYC